MRLSIPRTRPAWTLDNKIGNLEIRVTVGFYPNTAVPIEVQIQCAKDGSTLHGMCAVIADLITMSLQHGATWDRFKDSLTERSHEPSGEGLDGAYYPSLGHCVAASVDYLVEVQKDVITSQLGEAPPPRPAESLEPSSVQQYVNDAASRFGSGPQSTPDTSAMSPARPHGVDGAPARSESSAPPEA